jgi:hypothetical protein
MLARVIFKSLVIFLSARLDTAGQLDIIEEREERSGELPDSLSL